MLILLFSSAALGEHIRGEGQGSDADVVTRSGGDADLDVSQPEMDSGEIKVEIDVAVDPLYIPKTEPKSYSKSAGPRFDGYYRGLPMEQCPGL